IIGRDDKAIMMVLNDPSDPNSDVTMGKYGVTVAIGPATETKRALASEQMMAFVNANPQSAGLVMDLIADAQDWPKAGEFARRFKMHLPPGMVPEDEMTPEMKAMQESNNQVQQMQQQIEQAMAQADIAKKTADAAKAQAGVQLARAQAYKAILDAQSRASDVEGKNEDRDFQQVLDSLDQHNSLESEDRAFDHQREQDNKPETKPTGEQ